MKKKRIKNLNIQIEYRILKEADFIIEKQSTIRETAKAIGVSKSTVFNDMTNKLYDLNLIKYALVYDVLQTNKMERNIRGGEATKQKYLKKKEGKKID